MNPDAIPPTNANDERIQKWIPLALGIAQQHFKGDTRFDLEERRSIALLALCKANISYDETKLNPQTGKPYSFGTYAGRVVWDHLRKAAYKAESIMTRPSISNPRPELELDQQSLSDFAINHVARCDDTSNLEFESLVELLKSELARPEVCVLKGLLAGKTYALIISDLQRFKAFKGRRNLAIVGKIKKSIIEKMRQNGWSKRLSGAGGVDQLEQLSASKVFERVVSAAARRKRKSPPMQRYLFDPIPYYPEWRSDYESPKPARRSRQAARRPVQEIARRLWPEPPDETLLRRAS